MAAMAEDYIIDQWSPLDHKAGMGENEGGVNVVPDFVTEERDIRRVNAYRRLKAKLETVDRLFLTDDANNPDQAGSWREYGDPGVVVDRISAAILGASPTAGIVGADRALPEVPNLPPAPEPPAEGLEGEESTVLNDVYDRAIAVWAERVERLTAEWELDQAEAPDLHDREAWLQEWCEAEHFFSKALELETEHAVALGDGVMVFGWDPLKMRPTCEIYEPDSYFPELDAATLSRFPNRVHLAWDFTAVENDEEVEYVRRITYELVPIGPPLEGIDPDDIVLGPGGTGEPAKYLDEGEEQAYVCLLTNAVYLADEVSEKGLYSTELQPAYFQPVRDPANPAAVIELDHWPMGIDFIPVLHIPNTLSTASHFGRASLMRVIQLLDEIAASDTDEAFAAEMAARPAFVVSGMGPGDDAIEAVPGMGWRAQEGGGVEALDLSRALPKLRERNDDLLQRFFVNANVPESLVGRTSTSELPSGLAWTLSFTPFQHLIDRLREVRTHKYALAFKMVQRLAIQMGTEALPGLKQVAYPAEIRFGSFMPSDLHTLSIILEILIRNRIISQETAILMLKDEGIPIFDARAELASVRAIMGEEANFQYLATQDPSLAAAVLGKRTQAQPQLDDGQQSAAGGGSANDPVEPQPQPSGATATAPA